MRTRASVGAYVLLVSALTGVEASATTRWIAPEQLASACSTAMAGDTLVFARGVHRGTLVLRVPVTLRGEPGAVLDGGGRGTVVTLAASGSVIEDLEVRGSGSDVMGADAGVHVLAAEGVRLTRVRMRDVLYGIYAERATHLTLERCRLVGRVAPLDDTGDGNGVNLWYSADATIRDCDVSRFVDAVYLSFAHHTVLEHSLLHHCGRYGFHTMYCQEGQVRDSRFTHNQAGCAIMFSNHLELTGNAFAFNQGSRTYGVLLRDCSDGHFTGNRILSNTIGIFMDGSNRNRFSGNLVQDDGWGVLLYSSCAGNVFAANAFVNDDYPVALDMRRTDNRFDDGREGNYWSSHAAYDLDGDGRGDTEFAPVSAFAFLSKQYPDLTVLAQSPAVAALGVAEQMFPALHPSDAVDRYPRIRPPRLAAD